MKAEILVVSVAAAGFALADGSASTNTVADLGTVTVEASALSKYRPETVSGATFTAEPPERLPTVVDTLTADFIRERNPTDLNDLLRWVPGIETGGTSLLVRQPGLFTIRGMGGPEPTFATSAAKAINNVRFRIFGSSRNNDIVKYWTAKEAS